MSNRTNFSWDFFSDLFFFESFDGFSSFEVRIASILLVCTIYTWVYVWRVCSSEKNGFQSINGHVIPIYFGISAISTWILAVIPWITTVTHYSYVDHGQYILLANSLFWITNFLALIVFRNDQIKPIFFKLFYGIYLVLLGVPGVFTVEDYTIK